MKKSILFLNLFLVIQQTQPKTAPEATNNSWNTRLSNFWNGSSSKEKSSGSFSFRDLFNKLSPEKKAALAAAAANTRIVQPKDFLKILNDSSRSILLIEVPGKFNESTLIIGSSHYQNSFIKHEEYSFKNAKELGEIRNVLMGNISSKRPNNRFIYSKRDLFIEPIEEALKNNEKILLYNQIQPKQIKLSITKHNTIYK